MSSGLQLDVATPERVEMSLPIAGIGYRSLAYLVDIALVIGFWAVLYFIYVLIGPPPMILWLSVSTLVRVLGLVAVFFFQWIYWTAFEVLRGGQTPGKRLLGIRIVRSDGSPVGLFESAVRNLLRFVDFLPGFYGLGIVTMLIDPKHRRLGDLAAGTLALREERIDLSKYRAAPELTVGRALSPQEHDLLRSFGERLDALDADARLRLGRQLATRLGDDASVLVDDAALRAWVKKRLS